MGKKKSIKKILGIKLTKRNIIIISVIAVILVIAIGLGLGLKKKDKPSDNTITTTQGTTTTTQGTTTTLPTTTLPTTTLPTTTTTQAEDKGLSTGAIVGIVAACIIVLLIVGYYLYWYILCNYGTGLTDLNNIEECHNR